MSKTKVLIVEDDQEIARLTTLYLEAEGYDVSVVHEGNLALEAIRSIEPDLVLLDLMLPGMSGAQICRQAREFYNGIILVLTASADEMSEVSLFKFGADDYVAKLFVAMPCWRELKRYYVELLLLLSRRKRRLKSNAIL